MAKRRRLRKMPGHMRRFSLEQVSTGPTPNKSVLVELHDHIKSLGRDEHIPTLKPISLTTLNYYEDVLKRGTREQKEQLSPMIAMRVMMKIRQFWSDGEFWTGHDFRFVNVAGTAKWTLDLCYDDKRFFFVKRTENLIEQSFIYMSRTAAFQALDLGIIRYQKKFRLD